MGMPGDVAHMSGTAQPTGSYTQDTQKTIQAIAQNIMKANPKLQPLQLFDAVQAQIETMKGVLPEDKAYMQTSVQMAAIDQRAQAAADRFTSAEDAMDARVKTLEDKLAVARRGQDITSGDRRYTADRNAESRDYSADQGRAGREYSADRGVDRAGVSAGASEYGADRRAESTEYGVDQRSASADYGTDRRAASSDYRTQAGGVAPKAGPPRGPQRRAVQRPASGQGGGPAASPPISALKEGHQTTFANGQVWTLTNGKPVRVK